MQKTILIGFLFWLLSATTVFAQPEATPSPTPQVPNDGIVNLPVMLDCGPIASIMEILQNYKELPTATGDASWRIPNGQMLKGRMVIWINPQTKSFSITIQPNEDMACIFLPGMNFAPFNNPGTSL
jgi:hypothetical protein